MIEWDLKLAASIERRLVGTPAVSSTTKRLARTAYLLSALGDSIHCGVRRTAHDIASHALNRC